MTRKPIVRPRKHGRPPRKQFAEPATKEKQNAAVAAFDKAWRLNVPHHEASSQYPISSGHYAQVEADAYHDKDYPIADGKYRVEGSDWIFTFEGGGFVEAQRAEPPEYGGKDVIAVPAPPPGSPGNG